MYLSLLQTTAFVLRFIQACYTKNKQNYSSTELSATELNKAEEDWTKSVQGHSFKEESEGKQTYANSSQTVCTVLRSRNKMQ